MTKAGVIVSDGREDYSHRRPHSSLNMKAPAVFAAACAAA
jgi:transposase InsO family protein